MSIEQLSKKIERIEQLSKKMDRLAADKGRPGSTNVDDLCPAEAAEWRKLIAELPEPEPVPPPSQVLSCFI